MARVASMSILLPRPSVIVVCVGGPGKLVNAASVWILRNVLLVAVGWVNVAEQNPGGLSVR